MQRAKDVARYTLDNGQVPENSTYVPEPMEAELLDVFETISTLVSTLGYPVFEPVSKTAGQATQFFIRSRGCDATGELVEDGFVVKEGSRSRTDVTPTAPESVRSQRQRMVESGVVEERDGVYYYLQDFLFSSPSAAAGVVLGASANGWTEWKDNNGSTLSEIHRDTNEAEDMADNE